MNLPACCKLFGGEGKAETIYVEQMVSSLFAHKDQNLFQAIGCIGINPYRASKRELNLVLLLQWDSASSEVYQIAQGEIIDKFRKDLHDSGIMPYTTQLITGDQIALHSAALMVEVKSHDARGIKIDHGDLYVKYGNHWECPTARLIEQARTASTFLSAQLDFKSWIISFIYLPNIREGDVAISDWSIRRSLIFRDTSYDELIRRAISQAGVWSNNANDNLFGTPRYSNLLKGDLLNKVSRYYEQLKPTALEQEKLEIISASYVNENRSGWAAELGVNTIAFTGRAGTGKTVKLLRTAHDLAIDNMDNVLFLTFNKALARDLQRLMQLQRISSGEAITILTLDQLLYRLGEELGIIQAVHEEAKTRAKYYLKLREKLAIAVADPNTLTRLRRITRDYSVLMIDEAQDWFQDERDILLSLFRPSQLVIAVGTDQCLRAPSSANWKGDISNQGASLIIESDNRALRQTSNLSVFNNSLAERLRLRWQIEPNSEALGGQIYLFEKFDKKIINLLLEDYNKQSDKQNGDYALIDHLLLAGKGATKKDNTVLGLLKSMKIPYWDALHEYDRNSLPIRDRVRFGLN